jgi:DNA-binding response OmpR family regulator
MTLAAISVDARSPDLPLVVCVSPDRVVRERVARQLDGEGIVVLCPDLGALRALLAGSTAVPLVAASAMPAPEGPLTVGVDELVIDDRDHHVIWRGQTLPLTRLECELIARLASQPVRLWTYERLFVAVWRGAYLGDNSILHSAVKRLRRKLRAVSAGVEIETIRGLGYRLAVEGASG